MILSMTGYGKSVVERNGISVEVEIKTLNSRFLDLSVRLPRSLSSKELKIRDIIRSKIKRGKVILNVFVNKDSIPENFNIEPGTLDGILNMLEQIRERAKIKEDITLDNILAFQSLFENEELVEDEEEFEITKEALDNAIRDLIAMREEEGKSLGKDLLERISQIESLLSKIEESEEATITEHFNKLVERAKKLFEDLQNDTERLNTELALLTEKSDITEECVRLRSHIKMFRETLNNEKEAGKRLNFILQEMNREVNTINSKTVSTEIVQTGIKLKEELEKIREQIQNVE